MECLIISDGEIKNYEQRNQLVSFPEDEAFVIDMDAITKYKFNYNLYADISKYIEFTLMAYPYKESDLIDILVNGASRVVVNNTIPDDTLQKFLTLTDEIVMNCQSYTDVLRFRGMSGNMFLSCRLFDTNGLYFYYGPFQEESEHVIWIPTFPESLRNGC
ncbi:MAG: hypothetical protein M1414_04920 [Candidatus Thermoplasmatota archaeon]|jgi:hypothetical protein|nr:hypothetical protein [Candidatus Thermoplasmatota archaeon]MCL5988230.1 hypothetical protein [Candidatus Thermoplasmatota archaeon]